MHTPVTLICESDGARIPVSAPVCERCQLIQSLSAASELLAGDICVPFSSDEVASWQAISTSSSLKACAAALNVRFSFPSSPHGGVHRGVSSHRCIQHVHPQLRSPHVMRAM